MITNKTEYLIFILINLALRKDKDYISSRKIAVEEDIPVKYIPQLISVLSKKGWLDSARGINGGVRLAISPEEISVWQVALEADKSFYFKDCLQQQCVLNKDSCELKALWQQVQTKIKTTLQCKSIADLARERSRGKIQVKNIED